MTEVDMVDGLTLLPDARASAVHVGAADLGPVTRPGLRRYVERHHPDLLACLSIPADGETVAIVLGDKLLRDPWDTGFFSSLRTVLPLSRLFAVDGPGRRLRRKWMFKRNLPGWERWLRFGAGLAMIACGLIGLAGMPVGYLVAAAGAGTLATGMFGFCPACAVAGRKAG